MPRSGKDLIGLYEFVAYVRWFEVCKTSELPKGRRNVTFCVVQKVTQKAHGTSSCDLGSKLYGILFSWYFRLSSLHRYVVRPAFSDVLNRCERVAVHQTQDWYCSKMGYCTASSQGRMYSKRVAARYLCCGGNLFLRYADWMFRGKSMFLAFAQSCGMLIESFDLNQSFVFIKKIHSI